MDLMDKLPNEIWVAILDRLPSLKDQLRVQSVSKRFQSCLLNLFHIKPLSLVIDCSTEGCCGSVNESPIHRWDQMLEAVQMLADKAKLQSIKSNCAVLDWIFSAILGSKNQCLDKVTRVEFRNQMPYPSIFFELLTKCTKLSSFKLSDDTPKFNLISALSGKALTHLELVLRCFPQEQLVALLQSLEPNILKEIKLDCCDFMTLYPVALIDDLRMGAWAALEEIELKFNYVEVQLSDLFDSLPRLPTLRKCNIELCYNIQPANQFVSALTSLFSSPIQTTMVARGDVLVRAYTTGCQYVNSIHHVQKLHPMLGIEIDADTPFLLMMSLDHVTFRTHLSVRSCDDANCMDCGSFYPILLNKLNSMANAEVDAHFQVGSLCRCKIDKVVDDLNRENNHRPYKALSVDANDNVATITFQSDPNHHQFNITVVCGRCISNRCTNCIHID